MSAPQLTDPGTSPEWFRGVGQSPGGTARSPSQALLVVKARRQHFTRIVTYTMGGLVAFTLLGLASFAWRHHSMQAELAATPPAPPIAVAAPIQTPAPPALAANADAPAPPAPVTTPAPSKPKPMLIRRPARPATRSTLAAKTTKLSASSASKLSTSRR